MTKILKRHEELYFTLLVYFLLASVLGGFLAVRLARAGHLKLRQAPVLLSLSPPKIVSGARERILVLADRTHFSPWTTVHSEVPGVFFSDVRCIDARQLSFEVFLQDRGPEAEACELPVKIRSPQPGGKTEEVKLSVSVSKEPRPLELDLFNFHGLDTVAVEGEYAMLGYSPRGYAPFRFEVRNIDSEETLEQVTRREVEYLGVPLAAGVNPLELTLADALGREVKKLVTVCREPTPADALAPGVLAFHHALASTYTGKPIQWNADPTEQMATCDCVLGNGPLGGCGGGCSRGIRPPPNDYVTTLGEAEVGGDGVLLHNGQFREDAVDLVIPGRGLDFIWKRSYQSGINLNGYFGKNWDFCWGANFAVVNPTGNPGQGRFSRGDARRDLYQNPQVSGSDYVYGTLPDGYVDIETRVTSSEIRQTKRNGFKQVFDRATGNLKSRQDRYANTITVYYDVSGRLSLFTDTLGRAINVYFGPSGTAPNAGRLTKITDFANRSVTYEYREFASGDVVLTKVNYPPTDWFDDTTAPPWTQRTNTSKTTSFEYDSNSSRLTRIVDGRGKERVKNVYDTVSPYRVLEQFNYSSGTVKHTFTWTTVGGKVSQVLWKNRVGAERTFYFDTTNLLSTKREVKYTPEGSPPPGYSNPVVAATVIQRGCTCTLPTAIEDPDPDLTTNPPNGLDGSYRTFTIDPTYYNVTEVRQYADNSKPYATTPGLDLVEKAYFAAVNMTYFGACTKIVGPKAFTDPPPPGGEDTYAINITYDTKGNPITISYPNTTNPTQTGHTETRTYNANGQLLTKTRPEGIETLYTYYAAGDTPASNLGYLKEVKVKVSSTAYLVTAFTYSDFGVRTKTVDPRLVETLYEVDNEGLAKVIRYDRAGFDYSKKLSYNGNRALVKEELHNRKGTDPADPANPWWDTLYFFDDSGQLLTKQVELDTSTMVNVERYLYDQEYRPTKFLDGRGNEDLYVLDERGLRRTLVKGNNGPAAEQSKYVTRFDLEGKLEKETIQFSNPTGSPLVKTTRYVYDNFDRLITKKDTDQDATSNALVLSYDLASMETDRKENDAGGQTLRRTQTFYDEMDRAWKIIRGSPATEEAEVRFEHDLANRPTKTIVVYYDGTGELSTRSEHDLAGRLTKTVYPSLTGQSGQNENHVLLDLDGNGNVTKRTVHEVETLSPYASRNFVWDMAYDNLNRLTSTIDRGTDAQTPDPEEVVNRYDTRDLVLTKTDVDGVATEYAYDGLGRMTQVTYNQGGTGPNPIVNKVTYDNASNVTERIDGQDPNGSPPKNKTSYFYDAQNRETKVQHQDSDEILYVYNELSLPKTKQYQNGATTLKNITYHYSVVGLLSRREINWTTTPTWPDYDEYKTTFENFTFDGAYRLTFAEDNDTKVTFRWNSLDRITEEWLNINRNASGPTPDWTGDKKTLSTWERSGRRRKDVTYPISALKFQQTFDAKDRTREISLAGTPAKTMARYDYEGLGLDVIQRDRGIDLSVDPKLRTTYTDDHLGRETQIRHQRSSGIWSDLRVLDYTWGNLSTERKFQRKSFDTSGPGFTTVEHDYVYDKVGRLSTDTKNNSANPFKFTHQPTQFWSKLEEGATTRKDFLEAVPPGTADGSLQVKRYTDEQGANTDPTYDIAGNMTAYGTRSLYYDQKNRLVMLDHAGTASDHWFRYDALGRRVAENLGGTETLFFYDGLHIVEETNSALSEQRLSLFGVKLDEVIYSGKAVGGALSAADHRWPLADHLGSVIAVFDDGGNKKSVIEYTAYGEATWPDSQALEFYPYQFTGRRKLSTQSGIPYLDYRTRVYDPALGRFLQRDSIGIWGNKGSIGNGYTYVRNDTPNRRDPLGLADDSAEAETATQIAEANAAVDCDCQQECNNLGNGWSHVRSPRVSLSPDAYEPYADWWDPTEGMGRYFFYDNIEVDMHLKGYTVTFNCITDPRFLSVNETVHQWTPDGLKTIVVNDILSSPEGEERVFILAIGSTGADLFYQLIMFHHRQGPPVYVKTVGSITNWDWCECKRDCSMHDIYSEIFSYIRKALTVSTMPKNPF